MTRLDRVLRSPRMLWVALPVLFAALALAAWIVFAGRAERSAEMRIEETARETLRAQAVAVVSQLEKYRYLPAMLADRPVFRTYIMANPGSRERSTLRASLVSQLQRAVSLSGSVDIALAEPDGKIAASARNFITSNMIEGNELRIAPAQGRLGRASISGADGRRTYAFSTAIWDTDGKAGFVVVAAPLEDIERNWALSGKALFAANQAGQYVAANPLTRELAERIRPMLLRGELSDGSLARIEGFGEYRLFRETTKILDWEFLLLEPVEPVSVARRQAGTLAVLSVMLAGLIVMALFSRSQLRMRRNRQDRANALRLERRVRDRTRALSLSNKALEGEIEERQQAQDALIVAQRELIHAERLAAIGQVSATLAHEYNQPLAAVRTYAENAERYIERDQPEKARSNLARISELVDRMAHLSKTLLAFASKQEPVGAAVPVGDIIGDALQLVRGKAKKAGAKVEVDGKLPDIDVFGDRVRLGQVFVNLIANAIDAASSGVKPEVRIGVEAEADWVNIFVADNGTGIEEEKLKQVFEPFYTTKEVGSGLGLGLSIAAAAVEEFGGMISAANDTAGGAVFTVRLQRKGVGRKSASAAETRQQAKPGQETKSEKQVSA